MAHAVDEALMIERLLVQDFTQIGTDLVLVFPIAHVLANVVHHFGRFNVRTAVARTLKRCHRRSECGIRIRARRRNNARGKRGVIAAAVLHVQNKRRVQNLRFNRGKRHIGAQHAQQVFRRGKILVGAMDVHAIVIDVMVVSVIRVRRQQGHARNQLNALADYVFHARIHSALIISGKRQQASGNGVHNVARRHVHNGIAHKKRRKLTTARNNFLEALFLIGRGKLARKKKMRNALEPQLVTQRSNKLLYGVAAIPQTSLVGNFLSTFDL